MKSKCCSEDPLDVSKRELNIYWSKLIITQCVQPLSFALWWTSSTTETECQNFLDGKITTFMCEKKWEDEGVNDLRWSALLDVL